MQGYHSYGSGNETQPQLDGRHRGGRHRGRKATPFVEPVVGQHASTGRENVAKATGVSTVTPRNYCMCLLHDLKHNPDVIEFCHDATRV
jgi:hypothetical protein